MKPRTYTLTKEQITAENLGKDNFLLLKTEPSDIETGLDSLIDDLQRAHFVFSGSSYKPPHGDSKDQAYRDKVIADLQHAFGKHWQSLLQYYAQEQRAVNAYKIGMANFKNQNSFTVKKEDPFFYKQKPMPYYIFTTQGDDLYFRNISYVNLHEGEAVNQVKPINVPLDTICKLTPSGFEIQKIETNEQFVLDAVTQNKSFLDNPKVIDHQKPLIPLWKNLVTLFSWCAALGAGLVAGLCPPLIGVFVGGALAVTSLMGAAITESIPSYPSKKGKQQKVEKTDDKLSPSFSAADLSTVVTNRSLRANSKAESLIVNEEVKEPLLGAEDQVHARKKPAYVPPANLEERLVPTRGFA